MSWLICNNHWFVNCFCLQVLTLTQSLLEFGYATPADYRAWKKAVFSIIDGRNDLPAPQKESKSFFSSKHKLTYAVQVFRDGGRFEGAPLQEGGGAFSQHRKRA